MTVLYITNKPPYPIVDGGCFAMANFMNTLRRTNTEIIHYTLSTPKHPFSETAYPESLNLKHIGSHFIDTEIRAGKALPYLFNKKSYNVERFHDKIVENEIVQIVKSDKIDFVILESLFTTTYLNALREHFKGKIYVRTHNVEADIWKDLSEQALGLKKLYLTKLQRDLLKYEKEVLSKVDGLFCISSSDLNRFVELGIETPSEVINITVPVNNINEIGSNLYFLGAMDWQPNVDATEYLLNIFPMIRLKAKNLSLYIAGKGSKDLFKDQEGVHIEGFVNDLTEFYKKSGILVSPVFSGSGIRVKILEAMAAGIPVISSSKGASGIDYQHSKCLRIADTEEEFINACIELHSSETLRSELGNKAKAYIRSNHDEQQIADKLLEFINRP